MKRQQRRREKRQGSTNQESNWIPIAWKRVQEVPRDGKRYDNLDQFFNAMHTEYKHKIENEPIGNQHMVLYMDKNYIQKIAYYPTNKQNHLVERFMQIWLEKYKPKYFFRMNGLMIGKKEALGFIATEPSYDSINSVLPSPQKEMVYWVTRGKDDSDRITKLEPLKQHKGGYFIIDS